MKKKYTVFGLLLVFSLLLDQLTKIWARQSLKPRLEPLTVISGYFDFRYSENPGSAFGLFRDMPGARYLLFGVGIIALGVVVSFVRRIRPEQLRVAGELGLLAGGALGNIIDRVLFGRVTDFILWHVHEHEWPVFNIADAALVVGVIGLLFDLRETDKEKSAAQPAEAAGDTGAARKRKR